MKKIFSVVLALLLLTGCSATASNVKPCLKGISFGCDVTYYNETYECKGETDNNGGMVIEFISPDDIKGLKFTFTKSGVISSFKDTEYKAQKIVFENSVATFINEVLTAENAAVFKENDVFYTDGVTTDFEYKLEIGGSGLPIKITTRPDAVEVVFKNVKIK